MSKKETHDPGFLELSDAELREAALGNWVQLNKVLKRATPVLIHRLMALELRSNAGPRMQILDRLYGRLAKMRQSREKKALAAYVGSGGGITAPGDVHGDQCRAAEGVLRDLAPDGRQSAW